MGTGFYVNQTTGSDTLDEGRGESTEKPFKTIQAAVDYIANNYNMATFTATVRVASGYNNVNELLSLKDFNRTSGCIEITSVSGSREDVKVGGVALRYPGLYILRSISIKTPSYTDAVSANYAIYCNAGQIDLYDINIDFTGLNTTTSFYTIGADNTGLIRIYATTSEDFPSGITITGSDDITAGNITMMAALSGGIIQFSADITVVGDIDVYIFAAASLLGIIRRSTSVFANPGRAPVITTTGTITGTRYVVNTNGIIESGGGGAELFPGSISGGTYTGGQYN